LPVWIKSVLGDLTVNKRLEARDISVTAVMTAVVAAFTLFIRVPVPATGGYANLSDAAIFFVAFAFGPLPALVAGGVGAALADLLSGAPQFAGLSFVAHGLEGLIAGLIATRFTATRTLIAWVLGASAMVGGYFAGEVFVLALGLGPALQELPVNIGQVIIGGVLGVALTAAVRKAYPRVALDRASRGWREY
jgi:uncharacterized membrane protein